MSVPEIRISRLNDESFNPGGDYVLYWMIANRRSCWNFSLDRAIEIAREFNKPLVVLEALRCDYKWASDRLHRFVLQGMADNVRAFASTPVAYHAYVEPTVGHGSGLLEALAASATAVVTDDFPCFFLPQMTKAVADRVTTGMEAVDSNGLLPLRAADRVFSRAYDFRRWLQKNLASHLNTTPASDPLCNLELPKAEFPAEIQNQWLVATPKMLQANSDDLLALPIDHAVGPACFAGGSAAASETLETFFNQRFHRYAGSRNDPNDEAASGLSPYLHFGHMSTHEIFNRLAEQEEWSTDDLSGKASGSREGWWGMSPCAESFLDELITWRELGYNMSSQRDDYDQYESLPAWARKSLGEHLADPRKYRYELAAFEAAETHDEIWNAAQRQLVRDGRMHNYLRMLWGKKILEWSATPQDALAVMIELNNKYAVDGRNPNSYSGIFWVLGRYDRAWGPERPIFGKIRFMSSANTAKKLRLKPYLERYSAGSTR